MEIKSFQVPLYEGLKAGNLVLVLQRKVVAGSQLLKSG